jgi:hypothetical protein
MLPRVRYRQTSLYGRQVFQRQPPARLLTSQRIPACHRVVGAASMSVGAGDWNQAVPSRYCDGT